MVGVVINPESVANPFGSNLLGDVYGRSGEQIVTEYHGKYYPSAYAGNTFSFSVNATTLPVNAATLASKFAVVNPVGSGKNLELIRLDWAYAVATTVVNGIGVYSSPTGAATLTTPGTAVALNFSAPTGAVAVPYSAITAVGTPTQVALVGYTGAITSTAADVNTYNFDGAIIVPPGYTVHIATTVAATTASGFSGTLTWAEHLI
jgi:hypothetical protein